MLCPSCENISQQRIAGNMGRCPVVGESVLYVPGITDKDRTGTGSYNGIVVEVMPIRKGDYFHLVSAQLSDSSIVFGPYRPSSKSPTPGCQGQAFFIPNL